MAREECLNKEVPIVALNHQEELANEKVAANWIARFHLPVKPFLLRYARPLVS
jgi:hypothetical protein